MILVNFLNKTMAFKLYCGHVLTTILDFDKKFLYPFISHLFNIFIVMQIFLRTISIQYIY